MSEIIPLTVQEEVPFEEMIETDLGPQTRCDDCRRWFLLSDYYSEVDGSLCPLVGKHCCANPDCPAFGQETVVRVLAHVPTAAEGGVLTIQVHDETKTGDKAF